MRNFRMKPVTAAIGAAFVASLASASFAGTAANPFGAAELAQGYNLVADSHACQGKEGEGCCGETKGAEGKCGEGKCGEGNCGEATGGGAADDEPTGDEPAGDEAEAPEASS